MVVGAFLRSQKVTPQLVEKKDGHKSWAGMIFAYKIQPQVLRRVEEFYHMISVSH